MEQLVALTRSGRSEPWNKGKLVGQKAPLRLKEIWAIRIRLQLADRTRELALFNLAVDSGRSAAACRLLTGPKAGTDLLEIGGTKLPLDTSC